MVDLDDLERRLARAVDRVDDPFLIALSDLRALVGALRVAWATADRLASELSWASMPTLLLVL